MARIAALVGRLRRPFAFAAAPQAPRRRSRFARAVGRWGFAALLFGLLAATAGAQSYPKLHVVALAQRADRATVEPGGVFHVTIHVKVAQRRERIDELILGSFENCEIISNETVHTAAPDGTDFVERLTVQALAPGSATISPAYIDAIDSALGKPMRFSSNAIRVEVSGAPPLAGFFETFEATARRLLLALAIVASVFAALFVLVVLFVRRRRRPATPPPPIVTVSPPAVSVAVAPSDRLARSLEAYRSERSPAALADLRAVLFAAAGAAVGATLVDAMRALGPREPNLRRAMLAAENAAFGPTAERAGAGDDLIAAVQAYAREQAAKQGAWTR